MNIIYSNTEKHPNGEHGTIMVFGLAKKRGDSVVYSTRMTDALASVLSKHQLAFYSMEDERRDGELPWRNVRDNIARVGGQPPAAFIGMAWNIRRTLTGEQYENLVREIANAVDPSINLGERGESAGTVDDVLKNIRVKEPKPKPKDADETEQTNGEAA